MSTATDTDVDTTFELIVRSFTKEDDTPVCEVRHEPPYCSVEAKYVATEVCIGRAVLWCEKRYRIFLEYQKDVPNRRCAGCTRSVGECWRVAPL